MILLPFELPPGHPRGPVVLVLILEAENLTRMRQGDPFDLKLKTIPGFPIDRRIQQLDLVIAYEEDIGKIIDFKEKGDIAGLMTWLERGRKHEIGDLLPPAPLRRS